ncbi:hypothetical protein R1flu_016399 [Riccia fluitans]|uniref:Uncharacterized protein n=1 Tax=Riccia fluitans TaxID=41844 RepID=A0ABD1YLQ6_9MARC
MLQAAEEIFNELKEAIATYETISGVKLNIAMKAILMQTTHKGNWSRDKSKWFPHELLLAMPLQRMSKAPITNGLLQVWSEARKHLLIDREHATLSGETSIKLSTALAERQGWISKDNGITIRKVLKRAIIYSLGEWCD